MDEIAERGPPEEDAMEPRDEFGHPDPIATSRALERLAAHVLASGGLDDRTAGEITASCDQLSADRTNGENLDGPIDRLRELIARAKR